MSSPCLTMCVCVCVGGLDMYLFWEIMYVIVTLLCTVILPFAIFYYEVRDADFHAWALGMVSLATLSA